MPGRKILASLFLCATFLTSLIIPPPPASAQQTPDINFFVEQVLIGVNRAHAANMQPIIRVGVHGASGFEDPAQLVAFAAALNGRVSKPVWLIAGPNEPETELWASPDCQDGDGACVGPPVAAYMNAVISGAGNLSNIRLLSPAFNLCSPVFPSLIAAMGSANWGGLDGIAVNVYNGTPVAPELSTITGCLNSRVQDSWGSLPIIITETGAFNGNIEDLKTQIKDLPDRVSGALLFNAFNTNPGWPEFALSNHQINTVCDDNCRDRRVGVNFATIYTHGDYDRAASLNMAWTLEILGEGGGYNATPPDVDRLTRPCPNINQPYNHPLRPYPFNPCDPFIPERHTMSFQCGSGLNVNGTFEFPQVRLRDLQNNPTQYPWLDPNDEIALRTATPYKNSRRLYRCRDNPNQVCAIQRVPFNITIDLSRATLPVIGNTQNNIPDDALKANAYLSWYLQGADWTPSGEVEKRHPQDPMRPYLNFAGPIRKLFSLSSQNDLRSVIIHSPSDIHNYLLRPVSYNFLGRVISPRGHMRGLFARLLWFNLVPLSSMEDIVGETVITAINREDAQPEGVVTPSDPLSINAVRVYISRAENPPAWGSDGRLYFPHLRETYGLSYLLQNYALPVGNRGPGSPIGPTPTRTPLFSDPRVQPIYPNPDLDELDWRKRLIIGTPDKNAHQGETDATIAQFTRDSEAYGETWTRNTEIIDNPINNTVNNQVKRSGALVDITNSLDSPDPAVGRAPAPRIVEQNGRFISSPDPAPVSFTGICTISDAITHAADSLVDKNGWSIKARLTYTQVFRYAALPDPCNMPGEDAPTCYPNRGGVCANNLPCGDGYTCQPTQSLEECTSHCVTNTGQPPETCRQQCISAGAGAVGSCQPLTTSLPTSARVTVMTKTPMVREIYSSLVSGFQSVLRRFLPQRTPELARTNSCWAGEYLNGETSRVERDFDKSCIRSVSTSVTYSNSAGAPTANHPSVPDGVGAPNPSTTAQLYFPYLGSLNDYFLGCGTENLNLQRLLRPRGFTSACAFPAARRELVSPCRPGSTIVSPPNLTCNSHSGPPPLLGQVEPGPDSNRPDSQRQDVLLFNGRQLTVAEDQTVGLIDLSGPTDPGAPYFPSMGISPSDISSVYMLTGELACLTPVNLIGVRTSSGQVFRLPQASYNPFGGSGGQAVITYADCDEITLVYAAYDGIQFQNGTSGPYTLHLAGLRVDQNLVTAYQTARANFAANRSLPYVNAGDRLGVGTGNELFIGIRDTGQLMDPRTRKDWWQ